MKVDKLRLATSKLTSKVNQITSDSKSNFRDIANTLTCILQGSANSEARAVPSNKDFFRTYFRALNDYLSLVNSSPKYSQVERFGNIIDKPYVCALPEIKDMSEEDANSKGYASAKIAYVEMSKLAYKK